MEGRFICPESPVKSRRIEVSPRKGMTELSPRRVPRSPARVPSTPPQWKRPDEVMRLHRLKRKSLTDRFTKFDSSSEQKFKSKCTEATNGSVKRKNPFKVDGTETAIHSPKKTKGESANDSSSLFRLLGLADPQANHRDPLNFETIIEKIKEQNQPKTKDSDRGSSVLPVDWSLRSKLRFMSTKPLPCTQTLRTCEEASGITGFVRCLSEDNEGLDTSPNAVFHQCCLYWQYPVFPWLTLYPRRTDGRTQVDKSLPSFASHPQIKETLHTDFTESFRSVFQLLRARHCPYFYVVSNSFTCLFRAAGINRTSEISAMVCPTTQGFRQLLRDNDIEFSLPLRHKDKKRRSGGEGNKDDTIRDATEAEDDDTDDDDEGETRELLTRLGWATKEIDKLNSSNEPAVSSELELDGSDESLVFVEGSEVSSLFNFLINFRSGTSSTGPFAGVPATIISPVAFTRATLSNLQVRESIIRAENDSFYSLEMRGPILPDTIHNLCHILSTSLHEFSVTFATDHHTKPFSFALKALLADDVSNSGAGKEMKPGQAFSVQNLSDSGMKTAILPTFCSDNISIYDSIKFSEQLYNIS